MPSTGVYCSARPGSSRSTRAAMSPSTSVANVAGLGKPPVSASTPSGTPARIAASSSPPRSPARWENRWLQSARVDIDREGERAVAAGVERGDVLRVVGAVVQRRRRGPSRRASRAPWRRSARRAPARPRSARAGRSPRRRRRRRRCRRARRRRRRQRTGVRSGARETVEPDAGIVPRANTGRPSARRPWTSRQRPSITTPASPRRRASVANSSPSTASRPPLVAITSTSPGSASASALITGRWSSSAVTVSAGPAIRTPGTIARIAGSQTGSVLSASQRAETSIARNRSVRCVRTTARTIRGWTAAGYGSVTQTLGGVIR